MRKLFILSTCIIALALFGCDNSESETSLADKLSAGTWTAQEVSRDGVNVTSEYLSMRLTFNATNYTTQGGGLSWPASGTWRLPEGSTTEIIRDEEITIDFTLSDDTKTLTLHFNIPESEYSSGRRSSLQGQYIFILVRN